jgi:hypothetical protein
MAHRNSRYLILATLTALLCLPAFGKDTSDPAACAFPPRDGSFGQFSNCVERDGKGNLSISPKYVRKLPFADNGLAAVYSEKHGWMYVNRKGKVIISGVAVMDNGADYFSDGLVRFSRGGKWGFANESGLVVVPAIYDGAMPFANGVARVCKECESKWAEPECEHHSFVGGEWLCVNAVGGVVPCAP